MTLMNRLKRATRSLALAASAVPLLAGCESVDTELPETDQLDIARAMNYSETVDDFCEAQKTGWIFPQNLLAAYTAGDILFFRAGLPPIGSDPRALFLDLDNRFSDPVCLPDGQSVVAVRTTRSPSRGWHRRNMSLWQLPLDGSEPKEILSDQIAHYTAPSFSPDGAYLYFDVVYSTWNGNGLLRAGHRIQRLNWATGEAENIRLDEPVELSAEYIERLNQSGYAAGVSGDRAAAFSPEISPSGQWMAYSAEVLDERFVYRGHTFGPRTTLFVRALQTGEKRRLIKEATKAATRVNAQYSYRVFPGYAWMPDGQSLISAYKGKIHRVDLADGAETEVPFRAKVVREISEQVHSSIDIEDKVAHSDFVRWPASSPDGNQVACIAFGQLWLKDLDSGETTQLTRPGDVGLYYTPTWHSDSARIIVASWSNHKGGALWALPAAGGVPSQIVSSKDAHLYPAFDRSGTKLIAIQTEGGLLAILSERNYRGPQWIIVSIQEETRVITPIMEDIGILREVHCGPDDKIVMSSQPNLAAVGQLWFPYPPDEALAQTQDLVSYDLLTGDIKTHVSLPPRMDFGPASQTANRPMISPNGDWVAWESAQSIHLQPLPDPDDTSLLIETAPNVAVVDRRLIGTQGGTYPRWIDDHRLEFSTGNSYFQYDAITDQLRAYDLQVSLPKDGGEGVIALTNADLITMKGDEIIRGGTLVVEDSRIIFVGVCDPQSADEIIDLSSKTILPGVVDVHAHLTSSKLGITAPYVPSMAANLAYSVTTIMALSTNSNSAFVMADLVNVGLVAGPRTYSSGEVVFTQSIAYGDNVEVISKAKAQYNIQRRVAWGTHEIKNYRLRARIDHQYLIEAARQVPVTFTAKGGPLLTNIGFAMDGQTGWEHLIGQIPLYADGAEFLGRARMHYPPTSTVAGHLNGSNGLFRPRQGLLLDNKYLSFVPRIDLERSHRHLPDWDKEQFSFPLIAESTADIIKAGRYSALGEHGEQPGIGSHWEMWAFSEALSPHDTLKVATIHGAHFIGLDHELGSIEPGKLADLVILNTSPLEDTQDIAYVMKGGVLFENNILNLIWPEASELGFELWKKEKWN